MANPPSWTKICEHVAKTKSDDDTRIGRIWNRYSTCAAAENEAFASCIRASNHANARSATAYGLVMENRDALLDEEVLSDGVGASQQAVAELDLYLRLVRSSEQRFEIRQAANQKLRSQYIKYECGEECVKAVDNLLSTIASMRSDHEEDLELLNQFFEEWDETYDERPSHADDEGVVYFGSPAFGTSGQGSVKIRLGYDAAGNIVQRFVRKRMPFGNDGRWTNPMYWSGDHRNLDARETAEVHLQRLCYEQEDKVNFVEVIRWVQDVESKIVTIDTAFCPFRDLDTLHGFYGKESRLKAPVPEPVLWVIFERLVEAALIMRQGCYEGKMADWEQIVHCDIKPRNVFLDLPTSDYFPRYPNPRLGDFGIAFTTFEQDLTNPDQWNGRGAHPYCAPEMLEHKGPGGELIGMFKMLDHTNVFQIGMTMLDLIGGERLQPGAQLFYRPGTPKVHEVNDWAQKAYSDQLLELILGCIKFDPQARHELGDLRIWLREGMVQLPNGAGTYCQNARAGLQAETAEWEWKMVPDMYKLDMAEASVASITAGVGATAVS